MKLLRPLFLIAATIGLLSIPQLVNVAQAAPLTYDWVCFFDFTQEELPETWAINYGYGEHTANGVESTLQVIEYPYNSRMTEISADFTPWSYEGLYGFRLVGIDIDMSYEQGITGWNYAPAFSLRRADNSDVYQDVEYISLPEIPETPHSWEGDEVWRRIEIWSVAGVVDGFSDGHGSGDRDPGGNAIIHSVSIYGIGDIPEGLDCSERPRLYKPLADTDISPIFGIFDVSNDTSPFFLSPEENLAIAVSDQPGDYVYAVADGAVESIEPLYNLGYDCFGLSNLAGDACVLGFRAWLVNPGLDVGRYDAYRVERTNLYRVTVTFPLFGGFADIEYIVEDADLYTYTGLEIHAGCIIGKTTRLQDGAGIPATEGFLSSSETGLGAAFLALYDYATSEQMQPLVPMLTESVNPGDACNADPQFSECMGTNPRFLNGGEGWNTKSGSVFFEPGGGVLLNPGAEIAVDMLLDDELTYTVTVGDISLVGGAAPPGATTTLQVRIGTTAQSFVISSSTTQVALEEAAPTTPIFDGGYEVAIRNAGNLFVTVGWVCVTEGAPPSVVGGCYFQNPSFDFDSSGWTVEPNVTFPGDGTAIMTDGTLAQLAALTPGDYTLSARLRPAWSSPLNELGTVSASLSLQYTFDSLDDGLSLSASPDYGYFAIVSETFTITETTTDTFEFLVTGGGNEGFIGAQVDRICLEKAGGYPPPGTGTPPIFPELCEKIAAPNTNDVATWISWQWSKLSQFFHCELMIVLNKTLLTISNAFDFLRWQTLYYQALLNNMNSWLGNYLFPWLSGHFANIANGRTTIVNDSGDGCHDLFCLLEALIDRVIGPVVDAVTNLVNTLLWLVTQVFTLLLSIVTALIGLFLSLLGTLVSVFQQMINYLQTIVFGFNMATPTPLPGIPQCQLDPQSSGVCIALWGLENTVFADEGQLYIPLLIGFMSIMLLLWAIDEFREQIANLGDKL